MTIPLLEPEEVAKLLGVTCPTLNNWRAKKKGPPYLKIGRNIRYTQEGLDKWLAAQTVDPSIKQTPAQPDWKTRRKGRAEKLRETLNLPRVPRGPTRRPTATQ